MGTNEDFLRSINSNKYSIIYADPPWEYSKSGGMKNSRGMAKQHYSTMKL